VTGHDEDALVRAIREAPRSRAAQLALDPASISSPSPAAITGRTANGTLVRLGVSTYRAVELTR
jgi:hypothetical protein